jgi:predicted transcriptional regulator of viral defense system
MNWIQYFPCYEKVSAMERIRELPPTFTYSQARRLGLAKRALYRMYDDGLLEKLSWGLYRRRDVESTDLDLIEIAHKAPAATLCLTTALARHGLSDEIPAALDIAIPRSARPPRSNVPITWHRFDPKTFEIGREEIQLETNTHIGLYGPERCIIDAFRMRSLEGTDLGREALRRWLKKRGAQPASLLELAKAFPRTQRSLREVLEILL